MVNRAFDILEVVARDPGRIYSLTEIADELGLNHATCANIIKTMVARNYLEQVGRKKGYRLGFMAFRIGGNNSFGEELLKAASGPMEALTKKLNETSLLAVLKKDLRIAIHQVNGEHDLMVRSSVEKAAYNSASGRLMIAMLEDDRLREFIEKYGLPSADFWKEAAKEADFRKEVEQIRRLGYATQTTKTHIVGIAVAVRKRDEVVASLSMYLPESRYDERVREQIVSSLTETAAIINKAIS